MSTSAILRVNDLSLSFNSKCILEHINFELYPGERLLLRGQNGAGKTSLFRCLTGIQNSYSGNIELEGKDIRGLNPTQRARLLAYVPQALDFRFPISVERFLELTCKEPSGLACANWPTTLYDLCPVKHLLKKYLPDLSVGEKRRVTFVSALLGEPKILLLDETSSALDSQSLESFRLALEEYCKINRCSIIEVSHETRTICKDFTRIFEITPNPNFDISNRAYSF